MKLKCKTHGSRVMVLNDQAVVHRSNGHQCADSVLTVGGLDINPLGLALIGAGLAERDNLRKGRGK